MNQFKFSVMVQVLREHSHFVSFTGVTNSFFYKKLDNVVTKVNFGNFESIVTRVVATPVFVGSTFPVVLDIIFV